MKSRRYELYLIETLTPAALFFFVWGKLLCASLSSPLTLSHSLARQKSAISFGSMKQDVVLPSFPFCPHPYCRP